MQVKTVFFDLDGTLTQSGTGIMRSAMWAAEQMHCPRQPDDWQKFVGPPLLESFQTLCGLTEAGAREAIRIYRERYTRIGWEENAVYEGIPWLLRSLRKNGIRVVLVTSKALTYAKRITGRFLLSPCLDGFVAPDLADLTKTKAELIREAMDRYPGPWVMVGDRCLDVDGAKECGIPAIGVTYGYGNAEEFKAADAVAASPEALADLLMPGLPGAKGFFLSMEGVDGCGKSTQQAALIEEMRRLGWRITMTREPGGDEIAEKIRSLILDPANTEMRDVTEAYLYAASRAQNACALIRPALARGEMVICDRYVDSSIAYQGGGRQLGTARIRELNAWATENCMPDLTVYLRMEPHQALARRLNTSEPDRMEREKDSFFERTFEAYEALYQGPDGVRVVTVDASRPIEAVTGEMLTRVRDRLSELMTNEA